MINASIISQRFDELRINRAWFDGKKMYGENLAFLFFWREWTLLSVDMTDGTVRTMLIEPKDSYVKKMFAKGHASNKNN